MSMWQAGTLRQIIEGCRQNELSSCIAECTGASCHMSTSAGTCEVGAEKESIVFGQLDDLGCSRTPHEVYDVDVSRVNDCIVIVKKGRPGWQSDYVMESNVAYCLLTEEGEPSTLQERPINQMRFGREVCKKKIDALHKIKTWELVPLQELDVKTAFLHGNLEEEIYMLQPEGFEQKGKENLDTADLVHISDGCNNDLYFVLYVDDMLVAGPNKDRISKLKAQLAREFEMKDLGPANKILGMQIHRDRVSRKIWLFTAMLSAKKSCKVHMKIVSNINRLITNIKLSSKMSPSSEERMEMSRVPYASAVGSLMFAMICTRLDIAHAVGVVSRYMAEPGKKHWEAVKRILRYIKGTSDVALFRCGYVNKEADMLQCSSSKDAVWLKMLVGGNSQSTVDKFNGAILMGLAETSKHESARKDNGVKIYLASIESSSGRLLKYVALLE
ncbi:retrovirus-related pol polyprotein from transposon TNT 1-94 [Tanacetum coccineum]